MALVDVKVLLLLVSFLIGRSDSLHCFECQGKPDLDNCGIVTECSPRQICYVEKHVVTGGYVYFDSGCRDTQICNQFALVGKRDTEDDDKSLDLARRSENITCAQCCDKPFCNNQGCGELATLMQQRGPYCFSCQMHQQPDDCRIVERCNRHQVCLLQRVKEHNNIHEHYQSSCVSIMQCQDIIRIQSYFHANTTECPNCCDTDFCNNHC